MKTTSKFIFSATIVLSIAGFACSPKLTADAPAQITRVVIDRDTKTKKRKTSSNKTKRKTKTSVETEIDYRYAAGGKTYDGYAEKDGDVQRDFPPGGQAIVCYNPSNPEESDVFPAGHKCENQTRSAIKLLIAAPIS